MNKTFVQKKIIRRVYRNMCRIYTVWNEKCYRIRPYVSSEEERNAFKSIESIVGHLKFVARSTSILLPTSTWNCSYPQSFIDFINLLNEKDLGGEQYSYPLLPHFYISDLMTELWLTCKRLDFCFIMSGLKNLYQAAETNSTNNGSLSFSAAVNMIIHLIKCIESDILKYRTI